MTDFTRRLPARPSLEQLHKRAKELLRDYRAGENTALERVRAAGIADLENLAGAQFVLAKEFGFASWPALTQHVESIRTPGIEPFDKLANDLAAAYVSGNSAAVREINWNLGTAFVWDHDPNTMKERLATWFASERRAPDLALADARRMVASSYGFASWPKFVESLAPPHSPPHGRQSVPPFCTIDRSENALSVRGPVSESGWATICEVLTAHGITRLNAGGMTDAGMEHVTRLDHITHLDLGNSNQLTDEGLLRLARMPQLQHLDLSGVKGVITDRGLDVLRELPDLRHFQLCWQQNVTDAGVANLGYCDHLENVNLMGTPTGDGAIEALAGKASLRHLKTGGNVTDAGLALFSRFPLFRTWYGGEIQYGLMTFSPEPTHLMIDGPFTDEGLAGLAGLDGLFGLAIFWHSTGFTPAGLEALQHLGNLGFLGCDGKRCDDEAMRHIAAIPRLRMLMAQGTVASDAGFEALSRSQTIEYLWGRECPKLTGGGFAALAGMPALRGLAVSCKNVDDRALSRLPDFPALRELMPMDVSDDGFRHVGQCEHLESLWCMYCRGTGDAATGHIAGLSRLKTYYAGQTQITDRSLEMLGSMPSLERLEFWACAGITNAGIGHLTRLPRLQAITLDGLPQVSHDVVTLFPAHVRVKYSG
jgi:hypothetical protein